MRSITKAIYYLFFTVGCVAPVTAVGGSEGTNEFHFKSPQVVTLRLDEEEARLSLQRTPQEQVRAWLQDGSTNFVE